MEVDEEYLNEKKTNNKKKNTMLNDNNYFKYNNMEDETLKRVLELSKTVK